MKKPLLWLILMVAAVPGWATTTIRATSLNSATTGTAVSVSTPTGTTTGDVVVCIIHMNGNFAINDNNGSTPFTEDLADWQPNAGGMTVGIWSRRIQAGDPSTYNFTLTASMRWSIICYTFQNPHSTNIYDVAPSTANGANDNAQTGSSLAAPSITTNNDNAIHITCAMMDGPGATRTVSSYPSGYANAVTTANGATTAQHTAVATKVITPAGATGTTTITWSENEARLAISFAIRDEGGAPPPTPRQLPTLGCCQFTVNWVNLLLWTPCGSGDLPSCSFTYRICEQAEPSRCLDLPPGNNTLDVLFVKRDAIGERTLSVGSVTLPVTAP